MSPLINIRQIVCALLSFGMLLSACQPQARIAERAVSPAMKARFLLTFDDGPSSPPLSSTTVAVLDCLQDNTVQKNIKAIFFVQTRYAKAGGSESGYALMKREHKEDHILGLHSGTARGHMNHVAMQPQELQQSLQDGVNDLTVLTGRRPLFIRPTFWRFSPVTLSRYESNDLNMLMTDVRTYDGLNNRINIKLHLQSVIRSELIKVRDRFHQGQLPVVDGVVPVIVTFHDTNTYTAAHLNDYLETLVKEANRVGLPLSGLPFYNNSSELETAALSRTIHPDGVIYARHSLLAAVRETLGSLF